MYQSMIKLNDKFFFSQMSPQCGKWQQRNHKSVNQGEMGLLSLAKIYLISDAK